MAGVHLVFSYGTLKSGEPNFAVMNNPKTGKSTFVGVGETVNRYPLVVASQYAVPFLLLVEGKGEVSPRLCKDRQSCLEKPINPADVSLKTHK